MIEWTSIVIGEIGHVLSIICIIIRHITIVRVQSNAKMQSFIMTQMSSLICLDFVGDHKIARLGLPYLPTYAPLCSTAQPHSH